MKIFVIFSVLFLSVFAQKTDLKDFEWQRGQGFKFDKIDMEFDKNKVKNKENVKKLSFTDNNIINYMPKDISKYFPKIETLIIQHASLLEIYSKDLNGLIELKIIYLSYNKLQILPSDLFIHNKKLTSIDLKNNRLRVINGNVFDNLKYLVELEISGNPINFGDAKSAKSVKEIIKKVKAGTSTSENGSEKTLMMIIIIIQSTIIILIIFGLFFFILMKKIKQTAEEAVVNPITISEYSTPFDTNNYQTQNDYQEPTISFAKINQK